MKNIFKSIMLPILYLLLFFAFNHNPPNPLEHSLVNPTIQPEITHLNASNEITNELMSSPLYINAREQNAIICLNNEVITDGESSKKILEEFKHRDRGIFSIYEFFGEDDSYRTTFCTVYRKKHNKTSVTYNLCTDWELTTEFKNYERVDALEINKYGYLIDLSTEPHYPIKVINDIEIYDDAEKLAQVRKKYVSPIAAELSEGLHFEDVSEIDQNWTSLFQKLYLDDNPKICLENHYPDSKIPLKDIYHYLSDYFDITIDELHQYLSDMPKTTESYYIPSKKIWYYSGDFKGHCTHVRVTKYTKNDNILNIIAELYKSGGEPIGSDINIKVQLNEDGSFYYLSVMPQDKRNFYNKFSEKQLKLVKDAEDCFNRAHDVFHFYLDADLWNPESSPTIINNRKYYPCVLFSSMEELKTYTQRVFSKNFCNTILYSKNSSHFPVRFTQIGNRLYVADLGKKLSESYRFIDNSIKILKQTNKKATISAEICWNGEEVETKEFELIIEHGKWVLQSYQDFN